MRRVGDARIRVAHGAGERLPRALVLAVAGRDRPHPRAAHGGIGIVLEDAQHELQALLAGDDGSGFARLEGPTLLSTTVVAGPISEPSPTLVAPCRLVNGRITASRPISTSTSTTVAAGLTKAGFKPTRISTKASVSLEKVAEGFKITTIELNTEGEVPGIDEQTFLDAAESAKKNCPVSQALAGVEIKLNAKLVKSAAA